jgi:FOG: HEAT repeat
MDVSKSSPFSADANSNLGPEADPRLQPTPDYGTLGPGSDTGGLGSDLPRAPRKPSPVPPVVAAMIGLFAAIAFGAIGRAHSAWPDVASLFATQQKKPASARDLQQLDRMKPQRQAETLLELAVAKTAGATDQISSRAERWGGKVAWNSQIANLSTAALNSSDMRVRESGIEVELAAYGLAKNSAGLDYLLQTVESPNHAQKIWALWALGLMGNRGVQPEQVFQVLTAHLKDADVDSRRWAVESLALLGTDATIGTLLTTMHDDPSPLVRERAACSLAESGMLTPQQRMTALPAIELHR